MLRLRSYLLLLCVFVVVCAGCKKNGDTIVLGPGNQAPEVSSIPDQVATKDVLFILDLASYVTDDHDAVASLTFMVVSGGGYFTGSIYENTFVTAGPVTVQFLVLDTEAGVATGSFNVNVLSPPAADFTTDTTYGPATLTVNFTDLSSGDVDTWAWDFGDSGASTVQNPTHDYTAPGSYNVSLTATGPGGSDTMTKHAYIRVLGGASNIWYVDSSCVSATHDGQDWTTAFLAIQSGITAATDGDLVLVADGTYTGTSNKNLDFGGRLIALKSYDLYGSGVCTIDCEDSGSAFGFFTGETNEAVVDGFRVFDAAEIGGAGFLCNGASPTVVNCTIVSCRSETGAGFYITTNSHPVIGNCVITGNSANVDGAAVWLTDNSTVTLEGCTITNNNANGRGGGIYAHQTTGMTITNTVIDDNSCGSMGGGIFTNYCPATITNSSISDNSAGSNAGGMYFFTSTITMTDCHVDRNHAGNNGGGIYGDDSITSLYMTNCTVNDNTASGWGGGIYMYLVTASFTDCTIRGNETVASEANAGGVYAFQSEISLTDCTLADNRVVSIDDPCGGGALRAITTNATMLNCMVYRNSIESFGDTAEGGGLHFRSMGGESASVTNCTVIDNTATGINFCFGGGISFDGVPSQVTGTTVSGNIAYELGNSDIGEVRGGGIYSSLEDITISNCTISGNTAEGYAVNGYEEGYGGGIFSASNNATISACTISGNTVRTQGDGAFGGGVSINNCSLVMDNCQITGNSTVTPTGENPMNSGGGGIHMEESTAEMSGCTVSTNLSDHDGGGIYSEITNATMTACTISDNTADSSTDGGAGGGIFVYSGNTVLSASTVSGNEASDSDTGWCGGGGFYFEKPVSASLTGCTVDNNASLGRGGGFALFDASPQISNCVVTGNTAGTNGGGMYLEGTCSAGMLNCLLAGNAADTNGGGIHVNGSSVLTITNCTVADNSADGSGGGACLDSSSTFGSGLAQNAVFWGNSADAGDEVYTINYDLHFINSDYANATGDIEGTGNVSGDGSTIHLDPLFVTGPRGGYYLSQIAAGQTFDSPCLDAGAGTLAGLGLEGKTTSTSEDADTDPPDMGYHYDP